MTELKLAKLPDRNPIKMTISVMPDLYEGLRDYAALYAEAYGSEEPLNELVPAILATFLEGDRGFHKYRLARKS